MIFSKVKTLFRELLVKRGEELVRARQNKLDGLEFFDAIFFGKHPHFYKPWKREGNLIHPAAHITITVKRHGRVAGMLSFEILGPYTLFGKTIGPFILLRQMQAAKRAKFFDGEITPEAYLLACAEQIAKALGFSRLRVVTADYVIRQIKIWNSTTGKVLTTEVETIIRRMYACPAGYSRSFYFRLRELTYIRELN